MNRLYSIYILALLSYLYSFFVSSDSINICIKNAVEKQVELNKILTLCRENINKIEIYSNDYSASNIEKKSNYISTSKTDEIIYEMIKKGDLTQAARLATRLESEKTKRIKGMTVKQKLARAEKLERAEELSHTILVTLEEVLGKEHFSTLNAMHNLALVYKEQGRFKEAESLLKVEKDSEMITMAKMEIDSINIELPKLEEEIKLMLIPKDPDDSKNVVIEIRAGTGGDEASIFAGDLYRMYTKFCQSKNWVISDMDSSEGTVGGFKEVIFEVSGEDVYGILKYESGVHRVQRVPQTETQGRVHTSAATVMVLPEAEEFDISIDMNEVRIDYFCSSGPGGQSVNTTYSAVRLTHEPTGIVAQCQDQKSQHKNKEKALKVLRSRLYELELSKKLASDSEKRNSLVSSGDRSAKIRTYNYPQGRVTDHRIGLTLYDLQNFVNGDINKMIDELQLFQNTEKLKEAGEVI